MDFVWPPSKISVASDCQVQVSVICNSIRFPVVQCLQFLKGNKEKEYSSKDYNENT